MKPRDDEETVDPGDKEERGLTLLLRIVLGLIFAVLVFLWIAGAKTQWWG